MMAQYQIVLSTCPDEQSAQTIARALVEQRLAACVNILPVMQSVYLWKGSIQQDKEQLLIIKSTVQHYSKIEKSIRALHPYELPEIIAVPITDGLNEYLKWLEHPE